ncbi:hypothetical protein H0I70_23005, partial [Yersinia enterocolitica]|nr:hypothetical protein [Yersinia enterocolitica]
MIIPRPTYDGFIRFVRGVMEVPEYAIDDDDPTLECCYQAAMELIPHHLGLERLPLIYTNTVSIWHCPMPPENSFIARVV